MSDVDQYHPGVPDGAVMTLPPPSPATSSGTASAHPTAAGERLPAVRATTIPAAATPIVNSPSPAISTRWPCRSSRRPAIEAATVAPTAYAEAVSPECNAE